MHTPAEAVEELDYCVKTLGYKVAMIAGHDPFLEAARGFLTSDHYGWTYQELDPDVFGEELDKPGYEQVERIAVVVLTVSRLK